MKRTKAIALPKNPFLSKVFWFFAVFIVIILSFLYIYQINKEISSRFLTKDHTKKISQLIKENKDLELNSSQAASLDKAIESVGSLGFQKVEKFQYIRVLDNRVVTNYLSNERLED